MTTNPPISVSIVEDEPRLRAELTELISRSPGLRFGAAYASGEEAVRRLPAAPVQVIVMDINLPGMSGVDCTRTLKALLPETQFLMLTMFDDADRIFGALRAGASGYLLKRSAVSDLVGAIVQVHEGGSPISPQIARKVFQFFQNPGKAPDNPDELTERERELLTLLAKGRQYKEIADHLSISTDTVRSHIRRIYKKLHVHTRTEATVKFLNAT